MAHIPKKRKESPECSDASVFLCKSTYAQYSDHQLLASIKVLLDLDSELVELISSRGEGEVILGLTGLSHEGVETIIRNIDEGVLSTVDVGNVAIVGRGGQILNLLVSEDINCDEMALGMSVLASFGGGDVNDLARAVLDDDVSVFADRTSLHGEGLGGAGIGGLEVNVVMLVVRHGGSKWGGWEKNETAHIIDGNS